MIKFKAQSLFEDALGQLFSDVEKSVVISIVNRRDTSVYKTKIEVIWWSFHIEHITNPVTSGKKDAEQEAEATILSKMKSISLVRTETSDWWLSICWQPDRKLKFTKYDDVFRG
jgi:hypothetical protein